MSAVGGISAPLTSPTGTIIGRVLRPASGGGSILRPASSSEAAPPAQSIDLAPHPGFVLLAGGQGNGQFALASAELFDPASKASLQPRHR